MKLKLIQTAGFAGKKKMAEEELDDYENVLQQHVTDLFQQELPPAPENSFRDKEQMFLEFDGKVLPLQQLSLNPQLEQLIEQMNGQLRFEK